jgi:serine phosphatase RsbU (regulator of sigma subunit)
MERFPYEIKDTSLKPGDTILLITDGLPELKNGSGEMYGYQRVRNRFEDVAEQTPEEIITHFKNDGAAWTDNGEPEDDVTLVVIKVK